MVQGQGLGAIHYRLAKESGPDHNKLFQVELSIDGSVVGLGEGHTKKAAEQEAAYNALVKLKEK